MRREGGHLLAEILVGLGALVPAILLLFGLFPVSHRIEARAWERWTATEIAQEKLESLRSVDYLAVPVTESSTRIREGRRYLVRVSSSEVIPGRLKSVMVAVRGPSQGVELELRRRP